MPAPAEVFHFILSPSRKWTSISTTKKPHNHSKKILYQDDNKLYVEQTANKIRGGKIKIAGHCFKQYLVYRQGQHPQDRERKPQQGHKIPVN
jgi:hypothetical protein